MALYEVRVKSLVSQSGSTSDRWNRKRKLATLRPVTANNSHSKNLVNGKIIVCKENYFQINFGIGQVFCSEIGLLMLSVLGYLVPITCYPA